MTDITTRAEKGTPLSHAEMDANVINLKNGLDTKPTLVNGVTPINEGGTSANTPEDALINLGAYPANNPANFINAGQAPIQKVGGLVGDVTLARLNLDKVDNTRDLNKPVSTAAQTALDLKYDVSQGDILNTNLTNEILNRSTAISNEVTARNAAITLAVGNEALARQTAIDNESFTRDSQTTTLMTAETQARQDADIAEITARTIAINTAISTEVTNRDSAIAAAVTVETNNRITAVTNEVTNRNISITNNIATEVTNRNIAIATETNNRISAVNAESAARDTAIATAVSMETNNRTIAIANEVIDRNTAIATSISVEVTNRNNAVSAAITNLVDNAPVDGNTLNKLRNLIAGLQTLLQSDDVNLDTIQEFVTRIKADEGIITSLTTGKVNVSDIINTLISTSTIAPLSAAQGKVLNDAITSEISNRNTAITAAVNTEITARVAAIALLQPLSAKDTANGYVGKTGNAVNVYNANGTVVSNLATNATALRTYTLPDKNGTVALLSDISAGAVPLMTPNDIGSICIGMSVNGLIAAGSINNVYSYNVNYQVYLLPGSWKCLSYAGNWIYSDGSSGYAFLFQRIA